MPRRDLAFESRLAPLAPGWARARQFLSDPRRAWPVGRPVALAIALSLGTAAAQDLSPPPVLPAEDPTPSGFLERALRVDAQNRVTEGRAGAPLDHRKLFERLGRVDLVQRSEAAAARRTWLSVAAVIVGGAGAAAGAALLATTPSLTTAACEGDVRVYNEVCVPAHRAHLTAGVAALAGGVTAGLLLAGLGALSDPRVLDRDGTTALVSGYNARLARELRTKPSSLRLLPAVTAGGASLTASLHF